MILKFTWDWPGMKKNKEVEPWQKLLLKENWGYASLIPTSYQADHGAGLRSGIIGLVNKADPRELEDWGTLRAWAWGASRALDYFESDANIDGSRVAIEGLSRYGKAAMVAMAVRYPVCHRVYWFFWCWRCKALKEKFWRTG